MGEHLIVPGGFPTFGYFLGTPFPSIYLVHGCEKTVLTRPPLEQYISFYPIKASLFEDVQQQSFWDVAVRQYGFDVFHKRSLQVGAQTYYRDPKVIKNHEEPDTMDLFHSHGMSTRIHRRRTTYLKCPH